MSNSTPVFEFGSFVLNAPERLLLREGRPVEMTPRAFDLLLALVRARGRLLEKEELLRTVWEGSFVEEGNVNRQVSTLRRILGDAAGSGRFIETVPKRGYRFIAPVRQVQVGEVAPFSISSETPAAIHTSFDHPKDAAVEKARRAIAVLPFKITGPHKEDDEYLGVGLADALVTRLSNVRELVVRPTSAVARYSSPEQDILEAGRELRVNAVLDGRVQRASGRVRVTVQLVSVGEGATLWAEKFDERWTDIFALQDSISEQAAAALTVRLTREEREGLVKHGTSLRPSASGWGGIRRRWNFSKGVSSAATAGSRGSASSRDSTRSAKTRASETFYAASAYPK